MVEPLAGRDINTLDARTILDLHEYDTGEWKVDEFYDVMVHEFYHHVPQIRVYRVRNSYRVPVRMPSDVDWWIRADGMMVTRYWRPVQGWQSPWPLSLFGKRITYVA